MRIGTSLNSTYNTDSPRQGAQFMIERAQAARDAGLDSLFVGDHHSAAVPYYQNTPMLGRLLAEWNHRPAGCLFLLPLWNPVLVAEQVGTLAAVARGRFIFQCALGGGEQQFAAMGANIKYRPSAFEQSFKTVRKLLRGETVSSSGRFQFQNARIALVPDEPVEYWIGAESEAAIDRAARLGDGWIAGPASVPKEARRQIAYYRERCAVYGRNPTAIAIRRDIYVGESDDEAEAEAVDVFRRGYRGFSRKMIVAGSASKVIEDFRTYKEAGYTDIIVRHITVEQSKVLASFARLAAVQEALKSEQQ
jgi:alkanesulfonate monooxygenase SsuD/methylene tetrahydromethanopterin reductase-like flavin-dependent oxidoreductase (luciferase family)